MRVILAAMLGTMLCGCSHNRNAGSKAPPNAPPSVAGAMQKDVTDRDFVATISATKKPHVFLISIKRLNNKVDKVISNHEAVFVDLELRDRNGKLHTGRPLENAYAEDVNYAFDATDATPELPYKSGHVRLLSKKLQSGTYTVAPKVRIVEKGKDGVFGPYTDMGSVAVPAGNSISVKVR